MTARIHITDVIGEDTSLVDVVRQVKAQKDATDYLVIIDSVGGYVSAGQEIYEYLTKLEAPVTTYAKKAYSIASVIFMAGQIRLVDQDAVAPLMMHLPWLQATGNYDQIVKSLEALKDAENDLIEFYSEKLAIDEDTVKNLLASETFLSAGEAIELGLATEIKAVATAMAMLTQDNNTEESSNWMKEIKQKVNVLWNKTFGIKAELTLQTGSGTELIFPELESTDTPSIGDKAKAGDKDANGDYVMPDGSTYKFEAGELKEIVPADTNEEDAEAESSAELEVTKAEQIKEVCKWAMTVDNTTFAEGDTVTYTYEENSYPLCAGEFELSDGRVFVTDADGVIVKFLEKEVEQTDADAPTENKAVEPQQENETVEKLLEIIENSTRKIKELETSYQALAKSVGSNYQTTEPKNVISASVKAEDADKPKFSITRKLTQK